MSAPPPLPPAPSCTLLWAGDGDGEDDDDDEKEEDEYDEDGEEVESHPSWKNSRLKFWACSKCNCEINDMNSFGNDILVKKGDRNGWDMCAKAKDS